MKIACCYIYFLWYSIHSVTESCVVNVFMTRESKNPGRPAEDRAALWAVWMWGKRTSVSYGQDIRPKRCTIFLDIKGKHLKSPHFTLVTTGDPSWPTEAVLEVQTLAVSTDMDNMELIFFSQSEELVSKVLGQITIAWLKILATQVCTSVHQVYCIHNLHPISFQEVLQCPKEDHFILAHRH